MENLFDYCDSHPLQRGFEIMNDPRYPNGILVYRNENKNTFVSVYGEYLPPDGTILNSLCTDLEERADGWYYPDTIGDETREIQDGGYLEVYNNQYIAFSTPFTGTIISHLGTATPRVQSGRIYFTAGTVLELVLSDGFILDTECRPSNVTKVYNKAKLNDTATISGNVTNVWKRGIAGSGTMNTNGYNKETW